VVIVRMRAHQPTLDYVKRRTAEGKSKPEIIRCLKRFVAREILASSLFGMGGMRVPSLPGQPAPPTSGLFLCSAEKGRFFVPA
jgi:hypothetical protein